MGDVDGYFLIVSRLPRANIAEMRAVYAEEFNVNRGSDGQINTVSLFAFKERCYGSVFEVRAQD